MHMWTTPNSSPVSAFFFSTIFHFQAVQRKMEVQGGVQQLEPRPLGSPRSGANQQNELDDRQTDDSGRPSADNHSKDVQPTSQIDDKKVSLQTHTAAHLLLHCVCLGVSECL